MRFAVPACLAILLIGSFTPIAHAELRHYSSRLLDVGGDESLIARAFDPAGDLFIAVSESTHGSIGGDEVGPGFVIVKFDAAGNPVWAKDLLHPFVVPPPFLRSMAATNDGGVVLAGSFQATLDFGGGPLTADGADVFLVKLDALGAVQWQHQYGGSQSQGAEVVAVDGDGDIVMAGENSLTVDFGGGEIISQGGSDAFVAKLTANGEHIWSRGFGANGVQSMLAMDLGTDDRVALSFRFESGGIDVGDGFVANRGGPDILLLALDEDGTHLWSRHAGTNRSEYALSVSMDPENNLLACGVLEWPLELGGGLLTPPPTALFEGFVVSYDSGGAHRWSYMIPDSVFSRAHSLDTDAFGNCFVAGLSQSPIVFGLDVVPPSPGSGGLMLGFDPDGAPLGAHGVAGDISLLLNVDRARDRIELCGTAYGPADFGGGPLQPNGVDVALVSMGLRRPPQVVFTSFAARRNHDGVEVAWNLTSGEPLGDYALSRRIDDSAVSQLLYAGPAGDGPSSFVDRAVQPGHVHTYRLKVTTALGDDAYSEFASVTVPAANTALEQNAPNPFNPVTTFVYSLAEPASVRIVIYDAAGTVVATLDQGMQPAGRHEAAWGGHTAGGNPAASGVYFYRLEGAGEVGARKMVLLK